MIKRTSRYVATEYRPRHLSWVMFFSVPSYEYYYNRPLPLLHTFFPTHSSLLFYSLTIFGLHYIQNCKSQIKQNIRSSLFCDVSRRRVVASNRRFGTTSGPPWRINQFNETRCLLTSILVGSLACFTTVRNCLFAHRMKEAATNPTKQRTFYQIRSLSCSQQTENGSRYKPINSYQSITSYLFTQFLTYLHFRLCLAHVFVSSCIHLHFALVFHLYHRTTRPTHKFRNFAISYTDRAMELLVKWILIMATTLRSTRSSPHASLVHLQP